MAHQVARAIGVGELLEDQLAGGSALPDRGHAPPDRTRSLDEWINRQLASLKRRITGNGRPTTSMSQRLKMARFSEEFRIVLMELPDSVDIHSVGEFAVVREDSLTMADTWADRCRAHSDVSLMYNEVKSVLADLATARSRLGLGVVRIGGL